MKVVWGVVPALLILGFFAGAANWVPQVGWAPVRAENLPADTPPRQLARLGEDLVRARGCLVCHVIQVGVDRKAPSRAPNWYGIGRWATVDYLVESLYDPGAQLVEGYAAIMPAVTGPPANLSYEEMIAVIDYLQSLGGTPRVRIGDIPRAEEYKKGGGSTQATGAEDTTIDGIVKKGGCGACHTIPGVAGAAGKVGPDLSKIGARAEEHIKSSNYKGKAKTAADYIRESITDPAVFVSPECPTGPCQAGVMPPTLAQLLSAKQLDILVAYLAGLK